MGYIGVIAGAEDTTGRGKTRGEDVAMMYGKGPTPIEAVSRQSSDKTTGVPMEEWPLERFLAIRDHLRQRDHTRRRAPHLLNWEEDHRFVTVVKYKGQFYKVDGHTRAYLWKTGKVVPGAPTVFVTIRHAETEEQFNKIYERYDSPAAVETSTHRLQGAAREQGFQFTSPVFRNNKYNMALRNAYEIVNNKLPDSQNFAYVAAPFFKKELYLLDKLHPTGLLSKSGVVGAALVMAAADPDSADFLEKIDVDGGGQTNNGYRDSVAGFIHFMDEFCKTNRPNAISNTGPVKEILGALAFHYERYKKDSSRLWKHQRNTQQRADAMERIIKAARQNKRTS